MHLFISIIHIIIAFILKATLHTCARLVNTHTCLISCALRLEVRVSLVLRDVPTRNISSSSFQSGLHQTGIPALLSHLSGVESQTGPGPAFSILGMLMRCLSDGLGLKIEIYGTVRQCSF